MGRGRARALVGADQTGEHQYVFWMNIPVGGGPIAEWGVRQFRNEILISYMLDVGKKWASIFLAAYIAALVVWFGAGSDFLFDDDSCSAREQVVLSEDGHIGVLLQQWLCVRKHSTCVIT